MPFIHLLRNPSIAALTLTVLASQAMAVQLMPDDQTGVRRTVQVELELGGALKMVPSDPTQPDSTPVEVTAKLVYDEVGQSGEYPQSVRYYREATATTKVNGRTRQLELSNNHRLIAADLQNGRPQLRGAKGPIAREDFELVDMMGDSLGLDMLLPFRDVSIGETWQADIGTMQALTGLDSIGVCQVSSVLSEANDNYARCQIAGTVEGIIHGTTTKMELDGVYLVDLAKGEVTHLNLAIRQDRAIGPATPGMDVTAKLRIKRTAAGDDSPLTDALVQQAAKSLDGSTPLMLTHNERLGFVAQLDTKWYVTGQFGDNLALRRVEPEGLVAHANLSKLPAKSLNAETALADFKEEVVRSLGDNVTGVAADEQWTNQHGCRVMSVTVVGTVNEQEVEWRCYQVAPPTDQEHLHRLALTITVEKQFVEALAGADRDLVDRIELVPTNIEQAKLPREQK